MTMTNETAALQTNDVDTDRHIRVLLEARVADAQRTLDELRMRQMKNVIDVNVAAKRRDIAMKLRFEKEADQLAFDLEQTAMKLRRLEEALTEVNERLA